MEKKNLFVEFLNKFLALPLWLKEILFVNLREDLAKHSFEDNNENIRKESLYQYYVPALTYLGKKELVERAGGYHPNIYKFLSAAAQDDNIAEITLNNYWTLEEAALLNIESIEHEFVTPPGSTYAQAMALYLAGRIRIGEYFKRIGKIDIDQLDSAIRKQKELADAGEKIGMVSVMIKMGYISEKDSKVVLYIKDECKQRFIFNPDILSKTPVNSTEPPAPPPIEPNMTFELPSVNDEVVERLTKENTLLKKKIRAIVEIIKK